MSATPNEHPSDSMIGRQLGKYTLVRVLATGGMSRIYEAEEKTLGRLVAVKVLEQDRLRKDASLSKRFEREAKSVASLEHDHIIPIFDYGEQDGIYYMAMRLVKGKDLAREFSKLRRNGELMPVERALRILGQVASALDFAHQHNVIHRDVKPSNILIDPNDKAILTDFGLVMYHKTDSTLGTAFGTPRYISPEQALASNTAVPQSDIYSLAVILYEALTGVTPFDGDSPMQIALSQIGEPPPPLRSHNRDIPEAVEREVLRALEKDPANRHHSATELIEAVRRGYGRGIDVTPVVPLIPTQSGAQAKVETARVEPVTTTPTPPTKKRGRGGLVVALLLVLLLLGGGAALLLSGALGGGDTPSNDALTDPLQLAVGESTAEVRTTPAPTPTPNIALIRLVYDDVALVMMNTGDYELNTTPLRFVRGDPNAGEDEFDGQQIPQSRLPAANCMRIVLQSRRVEFPNGCPQIVHGESILPDANFFFWRSDPVNAATFDVLYEGRVLATCDTIPRGGRGECSFTWGVAAGG